MFELIVDTDFAAAHYLRGYQGRCESLHGHNWKVRVHLQSDELDKLGMVMDFADVKRLVNEPLRQLDHGCLNDLPAFAAANPTTENIAKFIYRALAAELPSRVRLCRVTAWETDRCGATYSED